MQLLDVLAAAVREARKDTGPAESSCRTAEPEHHRTLYNSYCPRLPLKWDARALKILGCLSEQGVFLRPRQSVIAVWKLSGESREWSNHQTLPVRVS